MVTRQTRDTDSREHHERPKNWVNPRYLLDPDVRPGFVHRWIRTSSLGKSDARNVSMKLREGWEPCPANDYPEFSALANESTNQIEQGGLILCRMPTEIAAQREAHFRRVAENQINAVDNHMMRENDPRMPLHKPERSSKVSSSAS
jgi:hypothetical protein